MTEAEAIKQLRNSQIHDDYDFEDGHNQADKILVNFLRTNGFESVAAAYEKMAEEMGFVWA